MLSTSTKEKIGKILQLSEEEISNALKEQQEAGGKIGQILISQGKVNAKQLYSALASQQGLEYADLFEDKCDRKLLNFRDRDLYIKHGFIPWRTESGKLLIAVANTEYKTIKIIKEKYGHCHLVLTSPFDISFSVNMIFVNENSRDALDTLWKESPVSSAKDLFSTSFGASFCKSVFFVIVLSLTALVFFKPAFIAINIFYFITIVFKASIFLIGFKSKQDQYNQTGRISDKKLPVYTILVPLFKEKKKTIEQLINAILNLDYSRSKLDVKLIVESSDWETKQTIINLKCERIFEIIEVPYSLPQTKPKAMNYALRYARGEYVTIYDAEDKPESRQLREAVWTFKNSDKTLACLQCKLNFYNREDNILTRMFALEYGGWFEFLLPGLEKLKIPIPLGGTSNHFPLEYLKEILAWDPYNVTEDADLGIRLAARGYKTRVLQSMTWEEAPIGFYGWMNQRSRWIKGHMQTYFVNIRKNQRLASLLGMKAYLGFLFFLGAPCFVFFSLPFVIVSAIVMVLNGSVFPEWFLNFAIANLLLGMCLHVIFAVSVIIKYKWLEMSLYSLLFPFYWLLHPIASFKAVWQLITRPYYWEKTEHGLTKLI